MIHLLYGREALTHWTQKKRRPQPYPLAGSGQTSKSLWRSLRFGHANFIRLRW